jgi:superfamily II DNA helicase RecQ
MQLKAFMIPLHDAGAATEEVNVFLRANRILSVERHFVQDGANSVWAICVSYLGEENRPQTASAKRAKVDYREVLSEVDFATFAKLRNLRKDLADREGIPAYALFTNEHLAEMVQRRVRNITGLKEIEGVGEARAAKYGAAFLRLLCADEASPLNGSGGGADEAKRH